MHITSHKIDQRLPLKKSTTYEYNSISIPEKDIDEDETK
jgi:hypothetical protein